MRLAVSITKRRLVKLSRRRRSRELPSKGPRAMHSVIRCAYVHDTLQALAFRLSFHVPHSSSDFLMFHFMRDWFGQFMYHVTIKSLCSFWQFTVFSIFQSRGSSSLDKLKFLPSSKKGDSRPTKHYFSVPSHKWTNNKFYAISNVLLIHIFIPCFPIKHIRSVQTCK